MVKLQNAGAKLDMNTPSLQKKDKTGKKKKKAAAAAKGESDDDNDDVDKEVQRSAFAS